MAGQGRAQVGTSMDDWLERTLNPLQRAIRMFRPGGGYGAGQTALIEEQAKQAQSEALANQVANGMSSGSLSTSTGLRVGRDTTTAKLGVEDTRTQFLNQALQALSNIYSQFGGMAQQRELTMAQNKQSGENAQWDALSRVVAANAGSGRGQTQSAPWGGGLTTPAYPTQSSYNQTNPDNQMWMQGYNTLRQ